MRSDHEEPSAGEGARKPLVVIACGVLEHLLGRRLPAGVPVAWMDVELHNSPKKLLVALQERLDALPEPSVVLLGYGLCGNGLAGLKAGRHTLVVPRTHDCVAIFLGSHQRYLQRFMASPNTYYLTKGWIDAKDEPLTDYRNLIREYDQETADYVIEMKYRHYRKLCFVGYSEEDVESCRSRVQEVVAFLGERFGVEYEEIVGTPELIEGLLAMGDREPAASDAFVVVAPGGEIALEDFLRGGEQAPQPMGRTERGE